MLIPAVAIDPVRTECGGSSRRGARWTVSLGASLRKELWEQRAVVLGVPAGCLAVAVAVRWAMHPDSMGWLPSVLAALAICSTALVFGSDLYAGEMRRRTAGFLSRVPRAVDSTLVAKSLVFWTALWLHGHTAWVAGLWAAQRAATEPVVRGIAETLGVGLEGMELPWLPAVGFASWLAAVACLVRQPGLALLSAIAPVGAVSAAAYYGLQGVRLESRFLATSWWWLPWAFALAPLGLAMVYRLRMSAERSVKAWLPALAIVGIPTVGVATFVHDWRTLTPSDPAFMSNVFVARDGKHAFANVGTATDHGESSYVVVANLEDGSFQQIGGPGGWCDLAPRVFYGSHRSGGQDHVAIGDGDRWLEVSGGRIAAAPSEDALANALAAWKGYTPFAVQLGLDAGWICAVSRDGVSRRMFGPPAKGKQPTLIHTDWQPFQLAAFRSKRGSQSVDLWDGKKISGRRDGRRPLSSIIALEHGWVIVPFRRKGRSDQPVMFLEREGGVSREVAVAANHVGWVVDSRRIAIVESRAVGAGYGGVRGWLDPATGERGGFSWLQPGRRNVVVALSRGQDVGDLLLLVRRTESSFELVWDNGETVDCVPLTGVRKINLWEGGDDAIVSDDHHIWRVWRDGRQETLFEIGVGEGRDAR